MSEFISSCASATWGRSNLQLKNVLCFLAGARVVWYSGNYEIMYSLIAPICCAVLLIAFCCCWCFVFGNGGRRNQPAEDKCCWYDCNFSAGARMTSHDLGTFRGINNTECSVKTLRATETQVVEILVHVCESKSVYWNSVRGESLLVMPKRSCLSR